MRTGRIARTTHENIITMERAINTAVTPQQIVTVATFENIGITATG